MKSVATQKQGHRKQILYTVMCLSTKLNPQNLCINVVNLYIDECDGHQNIIVLTEVDTLN